MKKKYLFIVIMIVALLLILIYFWGKDHRVPSGSAICDLRMQIEQIYGACYSDKLIKEENTTDGKYQIYETVDLSFDLVKKSSNMTIPTKDFNGVAFSEKGKIMVYQCTLTFTRYAKWNNKKIPEKESSMYITYLGYDDNDLDSMARATIDLSSYSCSYSDSEEIFENIIQK